MSIFIPPADPLLSTPAIEVPLQEISSEKTQSVIDRMFEIARGERTDATKGALVGLAAPQIGIPKRIILVDTGVDNEERALGQLVAYINPEITWYSAEKVEDREDCYSVDSCVFGIVPRAMAIKMRALDRKGTPVVAEFSGYTARIFQHEVDHLNGIRFPDRVGREGKLHWVEDSAYSDYRKSWGTWDFPCPWEIWIAMKEGKAYTFVRNTPQPDLDPPARERLIGPHRLFD